MPDDKKDAASQARGRKATAASPPSSADDGGAGSGNVAPTRSVLGLTALAALKARPQETSSAAASVLATMISYPLDSVKTRMQAHQKYKGIRDCVVQTYRSEGLRGFYRGSLAPIASISIVRAISFTVFTNSFKLYAPLFGLDPNAYGSVKHNYPALSRTLCIGVAGATSGAVISLFSGPFEYAKTCAQMSSLMANANNKSDKAGNSNIAAQYRNKGTFMVLSAIIKNRGFKGLYTGFNLHLLRDTIGTGTYFMAYDSAKHYLATKFAGNSHADKISVVGGGMFCGAISWTLIYPIDSAKTVYQSTSMHYGKGEKLKPAPKISYLKRNMYSGATVNIVRSMSVNALFWYFYERFKKTAEGMH